MLPTKATSLLITALLSAYADAQTSTDCNPLLVNCSPDPALGSLFNWDFSTQGESSQFEVLGSADRITYDGNGANFEIAESGDAPTINSKFYIMFGQVETVAKASPGVGIVSASVLISDDLDEIDWEWLGANDAQVQTNYFSKGDDSTFNRGGFSPVADSQEEFHTYTVEWTAASTTWSIDGQVVRVLENPGTGYYPQSPMQVRIGSWSAGDPSDREGTIQWAGGITDYSKGPFTFTVKSVTVQDYSTGSEYIYGDHSGSWTSIESVGGEVNGEDTDANVSLQDTSDSSNDDNSPAVESGAPSAASSSPSSTPAPAPSSTLTPSPSPASTNSPSFTITSTLTHTSTLLIPQETEEATTTTYNDGQYHPNPKYNNGLYNPSLYNKYKDSVIDQVNSTTNDTATTVPVPQANNGESIHKSVCLPALAISLLFTLAML